MRTLPMPVVSRPSELHSPWLVPVVSGPSPAPPRYTLFPGASDLGLKPPTPWREHQLVGWRGDWSCCCCRGIPQSDPEFFEKILLLSPAAPYKGGPVLSHSPPLWLDQDCLGQGPTGPDSQLSLAGTHGLCGFTTLHPYSPPCDFKQPGLSPCHSSLVWQGRELLARLSPRSPGAGPVAWAWGCSRPGPHSGSRDLFVLKQSPYHLFF